MSASRSTIKHIKKPEVSEIENERIKKAKKVKYLGRGGHVKRGRVTGNLYHFSGSDKITEVMPEDLEEILGGNFTLADEPKNKPVNLKKGGE